VWTVSEVVLEFPVRPGEEAQLFGAYLIKFMESRSCEAEQCAEDADGPFLMVRSDPLQDVDVKVLTFQESSIAQAFCSGWNSLRTRRRPRRVS
jgi:hypothetical protein